MSILRAIMKGHVELHDPTDSFEGKTVLVTGANTGLGLAAATKFALLGASQLILGVRSIEKGNAAKSSIKEQLKQQQKNTNCQIEVWQLDMLSYPSIKAFAARVSSELEYLDVAVLNAGVNLEDFKRSAYGWETMLQVNTISSSLLAILLFPKLRASRRESNTLPVLELVTSSTHRTVTFDEQHRNAERLVQSYNNPEALAEGFSGQPQYARSKLFLMYTAEELSKLALNRDTGRPDVLVTTVCPGPCNTDLARDFSGVVMTLLKRLVARFQRSPEQGSRTLVSGTLLGEKGHGQFWKDDTIHGKYELLTGTEGEQLQRRVWREIVESLREENPEIVRIIQS